MDSFIDSTADSYLMESANGLSSEYPLNWTQFNNEISNGSNYSVLPRCDAGPNNLGRYISMILFTIVCIVGLFGNTLVIYVVLR